MFTIATRIQVLLVLIVVFLCLYIFVLQKEVRFMQSDMHQMRTFIQQTFAQVGGELEEYEQHEMCSAKPSVSVQTVEEILPEVTKPSVSAAKPVPVPEVPEVPEVQAAVPVPEVPEVPEVPKVQEIVESDLMNTLSNTTVADIDLNFHVSIGDMTKEQLETTRREDIRDYLASIGIHDVRMKKDMIKIILDAKNKQ